MSRMYIHMLTFARSALGVSSHRYSSLGDDGQVEMKLTRLAHCNPFFRHNRCDELCGRNVECRVVD